MQKNILLWILCFLVVASSVYAADAEGYVNQSVLVWAHIRYYDQFYPANGANITILNPDQLTYAVTNQAMTEYATGQFYYNFTPTFEGNYIYNVVFYNTTFAIGGSSANLYIREQQPTTMTDANLGLILAGMLATIVLIFLAFVLERIDERLAPFKILFLVVGFFALVATLGQAIATNEYCTFIPNGGSYTLLCEAAESSAAQGLYIVTLWIAYGFVVIVVLFLLYSAYKWLTGISKIQ